MLFLPLLYFSPGWSFRFNFRIYYTFFWLNYWSHIRSDPLQQGLLGLGSAHLGHLPVERLAATLRHLTVLLRSCRSCCWWCAQVQLVRMSFFERFKFLYSVKEQLLGIWELVQRKAVFMPCAFIFIYNMFILTNPALNSFLGWWTIVISFVSPHK